MTIHCNICYRQMRGREVPKEWRGGMNVTYRVGGHFKKTGW